MRIYVPNLGLKVPLRIVGSLERLALLGLAAAPHHYQRVAHALRAGGSEIPPGLYQKRHHIRRLRHEREKKQKRRGAIFKTTNGKEGSQGVREATRTAHTIIINRSLWTREKSNRGCAMHKQQQQRKFLAALRDVAPRFYHVYISYTRRRAL